MKVFIGYGNDGSIKTFEVPTTELEGEYVIGDDDEGEGQETVIAVDFPEVDAHTPPHQLKQLANEIMSNYLIDQNTKQLVRRSKPS